MFIGSFGTVFPCFSLFSIRPVLITASALLLLLYSFESIFIYDGVNSVCHTVLLTVGSTVIAHSHTVRIIHHYRFVEDDVACIFFVAENSFIAKIWQKW